MKSWLANTLLCIVSLCFALAISEAFVRYFGRIDSDGNFFFRRVHVEPYRLPVSAASRRVARYLAEADRAKVAYDSLLGWIPRPGSISANRLYLINSQGIRSDTTTTEYAPELPTSQYRVSLLGDSFTFAEDVSFADSWGHQLESILNVRGVPAQVVNLGVEGYGIGQAVLRWEVLGSTLDTDVVVLGLQMENVLRSVNVIRPVYASRSELSFGKPRYVLEDGELKLVNVPTRLPSKSRPYSGISRRGQTPGSNTTTTTVIN